MSGSITPPKFPSESVNEFVDFIGLVPGDVATIRIEANSFTQVFIYKMKSADPVVEVTKSSM